MDSATLEYKRLILVQIASVQIPELASNPEHMEYVARVVAAIAHADQVDKLGAPYIDHVTEVAQAVRSHEPEAVTVALLHDTLDDCPALNAGLLSCMGFNDVVLKALELLRRPEGMSVRQSLQKILDAPAGEDSTRFAIAVKCHDLEHNQRLPASPTQKDIDRSEFYKKQLRWFREQI